MHIQGNDQVRDLKHLVLDGHTTTTLENDRGYSKNGDNIRDAANSDSSNNIEPSWLNGCILERKWGI